MNSKRKLEETNSNEYENTCKYSRILYAQNTHGVDKFESTHLHHTNKEMADFIRGSIIFMRKQQEEIEYLKGYVNHLQNK